MSNGKPPLDLTPPGKNKPPSASPDEPDLPPFMCRICGADKFAPHQVQPKPAISEAGIAIPGKQMLVPVSYQCIGCSLVFTHPALFSVYEEVQAQQLNELGEADRLQPVKEADDAQGPPDE